MAGWFVGQWNVDQLIQTSWPQQGIIEKFWTICGTYEEHILLDSNTIDLSEQLVHNSIASATRISTTATTGCTDGV